MAFAGKGRPGFGSVGRTFGSPFSGYRGDYTVYPDESWKVSLRKYPYPGRANSPGRRSRSVSPAKRRSANAKTSLNRNALEEILAKIDTTQGDLHALAHKVAAWSREAASLSEGLKEEAVLLELGRQADRLAASEAQHNELQKQERVYSLSMENSNLRGELRELIRIIKVLLDRRTMNRERALDQALAQEVTNNSPTKHASRRQAWEEEDAAAARRGSGGDVSTAGLPYYSGSYAAAAPQPRAQSRARRGHSYGGSYESSGTAGLEGLTEENAPYFVAADRAQAEADADPNRLASLRAAAERSAAAAAVADGRSGGRGGSRGGSGGGARYAREEEAHVAMFERERTRGREQEVSSALAAASEALEELTLNFRGRNRSGGGGGGSGGGGAPAPVLEVRPAAEPRSAAPTFGGFLRQEGEVVVESTPVLPEAWRRQQQRQEQEQQLQEEARLAEVERVRVQLSAAERELAMAVAEEAEAAAAADAAEAAVVAAAEAAAATAREDVGGESVDGEEMEGMEAEPVAIGTPVKLAEGVPVLAPPTPIYQGVPYGGGGGAPATVRRGTAAVPYGGSYTRGSGAGGHAPLDSVLLTEVEKLKRINKALAGTLLSYNRVASRLDDAAAEASPAAGTHNGSGPARALFASTRSAATAAAGGGYGGGYGGYADGGGGISLAAVAPPPALVDAASVTATHGRSSASSVHTAVPFSYTASYPLGVSARAVEAPSTPHAVVRHVRTEEARAVSWAPSPVGVVTPVARERSYGGGGGGGALAGEARRLDSSLDYQLYGIRQQLQTLRHDMVADRLEALTAAAPGGGGVAAAAMVWTPSAGGGVVGGLAAPSTPDRVDAAKLARLEVEVGELRRQVHHDRRWYHDGLDSVVSERSTAFRDLQRRIDRLMTSAI